MMPNWETLKFVLVNVALPLTPFFVGGTIRLILTLHISWDTFSSSELAICLALLAFFINQNLVRSDRILDNSDKQHAIHNETLVYLLAGSCFLFLFVVVTVLSCLVPDPRTAHLVTSLRIFEGLVFLGTPAMIVISLQTQRSYRLKASLT